MTTPFKAVFGKDDSVICAGFPVLMACNLEASTVAIISDSLGSVISNISSLFLMASISPLLLLQPDVGNAVLAVSVWATQLFVGGISFGLIALVAVSIFSVCVAAYFSFQHVQDRINRFIEDYN